MRRRRGAQFFFFMAENYSYSQVKNLNSLSPHFIFAHQTTLSFPSLFFSFTTLSSVSNDDDCVYCEFFCEFFLSHFFNEQE